MNRRDFLKTGALAAVVLAGAGMAAKHTALKKKQGLETRNLGGLKVSGKTGRHARAVRADLAVVPSGKHRSDSRHDESEALD